MMIRSRYQARVRVQAFYGLAKNSSQVLGVT
jgi:hypothetical protein